MKVIEMVRYDKFKVCKIYYFNGMVIGMVILLEVIKNSDTR